MRSKLATSESAPALVSDRTAVQVLGVPSARAFPSFLSALGVPSVKLGRRRYARLDLILRALDERAGVPTAGTWSEADMLARATGQRART